MSSFAEGIARRGAGLGAPAGTQILQLRARSKFDPGSQVVPGAGLTSEDIASPATDESAQDTVKAAAPHEHAETRPAKVEGDSSAAMPRVPQQTPRSIEPTSPRPQIHDPAPSAVAHRIAPNAAPRPADHESIEGRHDAPEFAAFEGLESTRQPIEHRESANEGQAPNAQAETFAPRPPLTHEPGPAEAANREAPAEPAVRPSVTISIGRISIDFGREAPAPAAPAARQIERTRGFEKYADARRGRPR